MLNNFQNDKLAKELAKQRIKPYYMQTMYERKTGKITAPDTIGADYFFLLGFLTPKMEDDFPIIEQEFLAKCRTRLDKFNAIGWYDVADITIYNPILSLRTNILRLIYNGAKADDEYCLELIKSLYKTYHKKEYNQVKRFKRLSGDAVIDIAENLENAIEEKMATARVLTMGTFLGIEIDSKCSIFYYLLAEDRETYLKAINNHLSTEMIPEAELEESANVIDAWIREANDKLSDKDEAYGPYLEATRFISECFKQYGYSDQYMQLCTSEGGSRSGNLIQALAMLKHTGFRRELNLNDVYVYSSIVQLIKAFTDIISCYDLEVGFLLGNKCNEEMAEVLFKPDTISVRDTKTEKSAEKLINIAPVSSEDATKEDYLKEIDNLRGKLREIEQDNKYMRERNRLLKQANSEVGEQISALESDRAELIALRSFVYNLKDENVPDEDELLKMKESILHKRIIVIGGHQKWHNKLKKIFPEWSLMHTDEYKTITSSMLENYDYVFFYSDYISHASYNKCVAMLRSKGIAFGYLHGVSPDITIKQVYDAINKL